MRRHIIKQIVTLVEQKKKLRKDILDELEYLLKNGGFDSASFSSFGDRFFKNGNEVATSNVLMYKEFNDLIDSFFTFVSNGGFQMVWNKGKGFVTSGV